MKKYITLSMVVFFTISVLAGTIAFAQQPSGIKGTTKTQQKPSTNPSATQATSEELAAINRLCEGLHRIKSNLQQIKGPLSEIRKMNNEMQQVSIRIRQESLTPHAEKRVVEKKPSGGGFEKSSGLTPAEKTKGQIGATQQMQKINGNARRIKGSLVLIKNNIEQEWKGMEGDLRKVSGSSRISSQDRKCISKEVKELENETARIERQLPRRLNRLGRLAAIVQRDQFYAPPIETALRVDLADGEAGGIDGLVPDRAITSLEGRDKANLDDGLRGSGAGSKDNESER